MTDPMVDIATLTARVLAAAVQWYDAGRDAGRHTREGTLASAVEAFQAACQPRALTWGQVPAGWEVRAPDGRWYALERTWRTATGTQAVIMLGRTWQRDPAGPVTARPGAPNPTDVALAALGWPQVLEDGS